MATSSWKCSQHLVCISEVDPSHKSLLERHWSHIASANHKRKYSSISSILLSFSLLLQKLWFKANRTIISYLHFFGKFLGQLRFREFWFDHRFSSFRYNDFLLFSIAANQYFISFWYMWLAFKFTWSSIWVNN